MFARGQKQKISFTLTVYHAHFEYSLTVDNQKVEFIVVSGEEVAIFCDNIFPRMFPG